MKSMKRWKRAPKTMKQLKARILKALSIGWIKGLSIVYDKDDGIKFTGCCLSGASSIAGGPGLNQLEVEWDNRVKKKIGMSIPSWNDAPGRTKEEVIKLVKSIRV